MKKLLITLGIISINTSFAMSTVNLDASQYRCNGTKITSKTTIAAIKLNCKDANIIVHEEPATSEVRIPGGGAEMTMMNTSANDESLMDKIEFHSDKGSYLKCYYNNGVFVKCEAKPPKHPINNQSSTSSSTPISNVKPNSSSVAH